uniref:Uncharacterized protein n=1 Tax=Chrysemys picta bellii TaxID=8478 RepID=A0A8C3HEY5_CHRPI
MPIAHLLELWKKIEVEPMDTEVSRKPTLNDFLRHPKKTHGWPVPVYSGSGCRAVSLLSRLPGLGRSLSSGTLPPHRVLQPGVQPKPRCLQCSETAL